MILIFQFQTWRKIMRVKSYYDSAELTGGLSEYDVLREKIVRKQGVSMILVFSNQCFINIKITSNINQFFAAVFVRFSIIRNKTIFSYYWKNSNRLVCIFLSFSLRNYTEYSSRGFFFRRKRGFSPVCADHVMTTCVFRGFSKFFSRHRGRSDRVETENCFSLRTTI